MTDRLPAVPRVSRRRFVQFLGAGTVLATADATGWLGSIASSLDDSTGVLTARLYRPSDQLRLQFEFIGLVHDAGNDRLVAIGSDPTLLRITYPRQHVAESPIVAGSVPMGAASAPVGHAAAANSRLVFDITPPIDLTVASLLDLASYALVTTQGEGDPDDNTTMIEVPADLRWSPAANVTVRADVNPFTHGNVTQLHRTFIEGVDGPFEFTPVFNALGTNDGLGRIPNRGQRDSIVRQAIDEETPAVAQRAWLTPHGAWADLEGDWPTTSWIQRVRAGRDQFAQVVSRGFLLPFGVPAVWTETATRLWLADSDGELVSTMVSETHFAVGADAVADPVGTVTPFEGRLMPFRSVSAEQHDNVVAQKIQVERDGGLTVNIENAWIPAFASGPDAGQAIPIAYTATDHIGQQLGFELPGIFVRAEALSNSVMLDRLQGFFGDDNGLEFRCPTIDAPLAWAEPVVEGSPTSSQFTKQIDFAFEIVDVTDALNAGELPLKLIATGGVVTNDGVEGDLAVVFSQRFIDHGLDTTENPTLGYLELLDPQPFPLGVEARAVMTPDMTAEEFNQTIGIGPIDDVAGGDQWDPTKAFGEGAQILKGIKLSDLFDPIAFDPGDVGINIPGFSSEVFPDRLEQRYTWCPETIKSFPDAGFVTTPSTELCVEVSSVVYFDGSGTPGATVEFRLDEFELHVPPLLGLVVFDVRQLKAIQPVDGPADLTLDIDDWRLGGDLSWLEILFDKLTPDGSAFDLDVTSTEIVADLNLPIPNVSLGVLSIKNFSVGLTGTFPYQGDGTPSIEISVGTKSKPVKLQILQFGGGFYLALELDTQGLKQLEVFAEVSARLVEIDIKIAKAYCEVFISAEFTLKADGDISFKGKLGLEAHFSVAGVIGATLSIVGAVTYKSARERIKISGTIHWSVTAVFTFDGKVKIGSYEFELGDGSGGSGFAGHAIGAPTGQLAQAAAGGDPSGSLGDVHSFATWTDYVGKFAAV